MNKIKPDLSNYIKSEISLLNNTLEKLGDKENEHLGDLLTYALVNSGKRVRPILVVLGSKLGEADLELVRIVELAVELIHIATLIHDDIIDHADLRRGQKTVTSKHGPDTALILGDYMYTLAFKKIAQVEQNDVLKILTQATATICNGEFEQLANRYHYDITEKEYYSFIEGKTASFFGAAARSGAILSSQSVEVQEALESYGINLGMSFQIKDDLLDLTGEEDIVGKTLRTDLINGKMTLPLIHYRNSMDSPESFDNLMDELKTKSNHVKELVDQVKSAGSMEYAENTAEDFIQKAIDCLNVIPDGEPKELLEDMARKSLDRNL